MNLLGHLGIALAIYAPIGCVLLLRGRYRLAISGTMLIAGVTMLPDVDSWLPWFIHRGRTHTVWFALSVGGMIGLAATVFANSRRQSHRSVLVYGWFGVCVGTLAIIAHLVGDVITPMGIRPFYPLADASYTFNLVLARDPLANTRLFAMGCLATVGQILVGTIAVRYRDRRPTTGHPSRAIAESSGSVTTAWRAASSGPPTSTDPAHHNSPVGHRTQELDD